MDWRNNLKKNNTKVNKEEVLDIPKIIFKDVELREVVEKWLGRLPYFDFEYIKRIEKKDNLVLTGDDNTEKKIGWLFKQMGVDSSEVCTLSNYEISTMYSDDFVPDSDTFSFSCHFNNTNEDAKMYLNGGDMDLFLPAIIINYKNVSRKYSWDEYRSNMYFFKLKRYSLTNTDNGNVYERIQLRNERCIGLKTADTEVYIRNDLPGCVHYDDNVNFDGYLSQRENEKELEQYLLGLSCPLNILEVYDNILELTSFPVFYLELRINKYLSEQEFINTDYIIMDHGCVSICMITRNGKTIMLDDSGNWSYKSARLSLDRNNGLKINFNNQMEEHTADELLAIEQMNQISEEVKGIEEEVQEVKHLTRSLFKK